MTMTYRVMGSGTKQSRSCSQRSLSLLYRGPFIEDGSDHDRRILTPADASPGRRPQPPTRSKVRNRCISPAARHSGDCLLSEPIAGTLSLGRRNASSCPRTGRSMVPLRAVRCRQPPTSTAFCRRRARLAIAQPVQRRDPGSVTAADLAKVGSCLSLFGTVGAFQPERAAIAIALDQSALSEKGDPMNSAKYTAAALFLSLAVAAAPASAQTKDTPWKDTPWVEIETISVIAGVGGQNGEGQLNLPNLGTNCVHPFTVSGFGAGLQVGVSKVTASGPVKNLTQIEDFPGTYSATGGQATLVAGGSSMS